jgi:hypothetical protein
MSDFLQRVASPLLLLLIKYIRRDRNLLPLRAS